MFAHCRGVSPSNRQDEEQVIGTYAADQSHDAKTVSQPSSFVRAVSSATLSHGE